MSRYNLCPQDCVEAARCEVAQLARSSAQPTLASIIRPFVPDTVINRLSDGVVSGH